MAPMIHSEMWSVTEHGGFLPARPARTPSGPHLDSILSEVLNAASMLSSLTDYDIRALVAGLSAPSDAVLKSVRGDELEGCLRAYAFLTARFVHSDALASNGSQKILPPALAVPMWAFSDRVGRPPSLTYATYILSNWTGDIGPRTTLDCIDVPVTFSDTVDEKWFITAHLAVESTGSELVCALAQCHRGLLDRDGATVAEGLGTIADALTWSRGQLARITERLDKTTFLERVRPYLFGHDNLIFEGVPESPRVSYIGETGAQSGAIRAADVGLGVKHATPIGRPMAQFLAYAPPPHREYMSNTTRLGERLYAEAAANVLVAPAYNAAVEALAGFRRTHGEVVDQFLSADSGPRPGMGTGGTPYKSWLRGLAVEAEAMTIR